MELVFYEATSTFTLLTTRIFARRPYADFVDGLHKVTFPSPPAIQATWLPALAMTGLSPVRKRRPSLGTPQTQARPLFVSPIPGQNGPLKTRGESAIIGPSHSELPVLPAYTEGGLTCRIKLDSAIVNPSSFTQSNYVISGINQFEIAASGKIKHIEAISDNTHAINPNIILHEMKYKKFYEFYATKDYYAIRSHIDDCIGAGFPVSCHGVFGTHDLLFQGFDEDLEFFQLRLKHYLKGIYDNLEGEEEQRSAERIEITDVLKYRGIDLTAQSASAVPQSLLEEHRSTMHCLANNTRVDEAALNLLLKNGVAFPVDGHSDITPIDRAIGREEFLLIIFFLPPENISESRAVQEFKRIVLSKLMQHDKVRTIEFSKQKPISRNLAMGDYIVHIVGKLSDVKDITLDIIHKPLLHTGVRCGTRVIPPAEPISPDAYYVLNETKVDRTDSLEIMKKIISLCKSERDPFLIKRLPQREIARITHVFHEHSSYVDEILKNPKLKDLIPSERYEENIGRFIYGISYGLLSQLNVSRELLRFMRSNCRESYSDVIDRVEEILNNERHKIRSIYDGISDERKKLRYEKALKDHNQLNTLVGRQSIMGSIIELIAKWNERICDPSDRSVDPSYLDEVKKMHQPIEVRNLLTHDSRENQERLENTKLSKFASDLIEGSIYAFDFVKKSWAAET